MLFNETERAPNLYKKNGKEGRNHVQGSENGPTFLELFNSDHSIEPNGPPYTLVSITTPGGKPLKSTGRKSNPSSDTEPSAIS